jgi:hypothetical protein
VTAVGKNNKERKKERTKERNKEEENIHNINNKTAETCVRHRQTSFF